MDSVCSIVRQMEKDYQAGNTTISKYVSFDLYETINKVDAYLNSKHTSGSEDSIGREKPFFNIVTAARNIWYRATDIDRKNIKLRTPSTTLVAETFVANMLVKRWMKKARFGIFLNEWGRTQATYGSAVSKFVEKDGELHASVIPWNRIICDAIDFDANVKIEVLEFTPAQLRKQKGYDQEMVKQLLTALTAREDLNKQKKDNKANYVKVYEVHGEMSVADYKKGMGQEPTEGDKDIFKQQMHVVSFVATKAGRGKSDYQDFTLYCGYEKQDPYQKDDLISEDGRVLGIGAIENLFEAQWMVNHTAKQIKDTLDFASLLILQTSDGALVGRNVLSSLVTGDILIHAENSPLTQLNNQHDITQIQAFSSQWQSLGREINGISEAMATGKVNAGSAWRQTEALLQESHSLFELMRQNKGLSIEDMFRKFVLPFVKTQMDTTEEVTDILESAGIAQFSSLYVPNESIRRTNKIKKDLILSGQIAPDLPPNALEGDITKEMSGLGNVRSIKPSDLDSVTWKESLKDLEMEMEVDPTQEFEDVEESLTSLTTTLKTIAAFAGRPMNPNEQMVFNKIMEKAGNLSPIELSQNQSVQPQTQQATPATGGSMPENQQVMPMMAGAK